MSPLRSIAAILGGAVLLGFMDRTLERTLVAAMAEAPPADEAAYLAIRDQPLVLGVTVATHGLAAILAGYIGAKIAGAHEARHALATAVLLIAGYAVAFTSDNVMLPPVWVRVALLVITAPALLAGASIRAQARALPSEQAGTARPEERS
jgi:hypothetical protein